MLVSKRAARCAAALIEKKTPNQQTVRVWGHLWLTLWMTEMLEKRWWCSVAVMVLLRASLSLKWRTRMPRLCRYECSEVMISKMACRKAARISAQL